MLLAALSLAGFLLRSHWALVEDPRLRATTTRRLPHLVDSLLLACGVWMAVQAGFDPRLHPWLLAKLIFLLAYILAGIGVLRWARNRQQRALCLCLALLSFLVMVLLAWLKPYPA